jgi:hypothetical protein
MRRSIHESMIQAIRSSSSAGIPGRLLASGLINATQLELVQNE